MKAEANIEIEKSSTFDLAKLSVTDNREIKFEIKQNTLAIIDDNELVIDIDTNEKIMQEIEDYNAYQQSLNMY